MGEALVTATVTEEPRGISNMQNQPLPSRQRPLVLCIEDNLANRILMKSIFKTHVDADLVIAANAETGLDMAADKSPDLILMDIHLPGMSGLEAMDRLRETHDLANIPVISVTVDALPRQIAAMKGRGFLHCVTKPFNIKDLVRLIHETLARDGCRQLAG